MEVTSSLDLTCILMNEQGELLGEHDRWFDLKQTGT
jgi:hypothetical protein